MLKVLIALVVGIGALAAGVVPEAHAQSNPYPEVWRRGQLLAPGQSLFLLSSSYSRFSDRLSENGEPTSLGSAYTQSITWEDLLGGRQQLSPEDQQLREFVESQGIALDSAAAHSVLEISQQLLNLSPQWAYGMTESWMVGFRLPVVYRKTEVSTRIEVTEAYSHLSQNAVSAEEVSLTQSMQGRAREALARKLQEYNYEPIREQQEEWVFGDAELLSKVRLWQNPQSLLALRQRIVLPTASAQSPYRYVESPSGDGQLDLGLDSVVDYWVAPRWLLTANVGYTWQAPDQIRARLPREGQGVSQDVDLEVSRDLGDYWSASLYAERFLKKGWRLLGGYSFRKKSEDRYEGGGFSQERYEALSRGTEQDLHMGHAGVSYKADPLYERLGLKKQFSASFYVSSVLAGSNVPDTTLAGFDFQFLF